MVLKIHCYLEILELTCSQKIQCRKRNSRAVFNRMVTVLKSSDLQTEKLLKILTTEFKNGFQKENGGNIILLHQGTTYMFKYIGTH